MVATYNTRTSPRVRDTWERGARIGNLCIRALWIVLDSGALVRNFFAEDVTPGEETNNTPCINHFPYLTKKCLEQKQEDIVEAEIQAARKGTAEDMWRTLWNNENLGYLETEYVNATTLFRDIEKWYGKLNAKIGYKWQLKGGAGDKWQIQFIYTYTRI